MKNRSIPPFKGVSNNTAFWDAGSPFAPPEALSNVLCYDATKERPRMGTRPGTSAYFYGTFGNGQAVRGCGVVSRGKTPTGYTLGTGSDLTDTGTPHIQQTVTGNIFRAAATFGLTRYAYENVQAGQGFTENNGDPESGAAAISVNAVAISPDQTKIIVGESYTDGSSSRVARVTCRDATTLAVIWSKKMSDTGINRFVNAIACSSDWVFVATNHFIRVFRLSNGANPASGNSTYGFNGWSSEAIDVKVSSDGTTLYGLFLGSSLGATLDSGTVVTAGVYAKHFRSGVMKFTIKTVANLAGGQVLTQATLSPQLATNAQYYEGNGTTKHNYCRFSEQLPWAPRGLQPTGLALRPSGGFVVTHANAGWGPNGDPNDDDYFAADGSVGRRNISAFKADGTFDWWYDGDSISNVPGSGGLWNDILDPTAITVTTDASGNIIFGGRRTKALPDSDGTSVFALNRYGDYLWDADLGGTVRCLAVLPSSQSIIAGTDRNSDYPSASGVKCQLFKLSSGDGTILKKLPDLGNASVLSAVGIGFNGPVAQGQDRDAVAFVTDHV